MSRGSSYHAGLHEPPAPPNSRVLTRCGSGWMEHRMLYEQVASRGRQATTIDNIRSVFNRNGSFRSGFDPLHHYHQRPPWRQSADEDCACESSQRNVWDPKKTAQSKRVLSVSINRIALYNHPLSSSEDHLYVQLRLIYSDYRRHLETNTAHCLRIRLKTLLEGMCNACPKNAKAILCHRDDHNGQQDGGSSEGADCEHYCGDAMHSVCAALCASLGLLLSEELTIVDLAERLYTTWNKLKNIRRRQGFVSTPARLVAINVRHKRTAMGSVGTCIHAPQTEHLINQLEEELPWFVLCTPTSLLWQEGRRFDDAIAGIGGNVMEHAVEPGRVCPTIKSFLQTCREVYRSVKSEFVLKLYTTAAVTVDDSKTLPISELLRRRRIHQQRFYMSLAANEGVIATTRTVPFDWPSFTLPIDHRFQLCFRRRSIHMSAHLWQRRLLKDLHLAMMLVPVPDVSSSNSAPVHSLAPTRDWFHFVSARIAPDISYIIGDEAEAMSHGKNALNSVVSRNAAKRAVNPNYTSNGWHVASGLCPDSRTLTTVKKASKLEDIDTCTRDPGSIVAIHLGSSDFRLTDMLIYRGVTLPLERWCSCVKDGKYRHVIGSALMSICWRGPDVLPLRNSTPKKSDEKKKTYKSTGLQGSYPSRGPFCKPHIKLPFLSQTQASQHKPITSIRTAVVSLGRRDTSQGGRTVLTRGYRREHVQDPNCPHLRQFLGETDLAGRDARRLMESVSACESNMRLHFAFDSGITMVVDTVVVHRCRSSTLAQLRLRELELVTLSDASRVTRARCPLCPGLRNGSTKHSRGLRRIRYFSMDGKVQLHNQTWPHRHPLASLTSVDDGSESLMIQTRCFLRQARAVLRPKCKALRSRSRTLVSATARCAILVQVIAAYNLPTFTIPQRTLVCNELPSQQSLATGEVTSQGVIPPLVLSSSGTYVIASFQDRRQRTRIAVGRPARWKETLELPLSADVDASSPGLAQVTYPLHLSMFSENIVAVSAMKDRGRDVACIFLGDVSIPFSTLIHNGNKGGCVEAVICLQMPIAHLGFCNADAGMHEPTAKDLTSAIESKPGRNRDVDPSRNVIQSVSRIPLHLAVFFRPATFASVTYEATLKSTVEDVALLRHGASWIGQLRTHLQKLERTLKYPRARHLHARFFPVFANGTKGDAVLACRYLRPLRPPPNITNASQAARFVSLIPFSVDIAKCGCTSSTIWCTSQDFLDIGVGDWQEHAFLLYNYIAWLQLQDLNQAPDSLRTELFLVFGFGFPEGEAAYVMQRQRHSMRPDDVVFWSPFTGQSFTAADRACPLLDIGCLVTPDNVYANIQDQTAPKQLSFDHSDISHWRPLFTSLGAASSIGCSRLNCAHAKPTLCCPAALVSIQPPSLRYEVPDWFGAKKIQSEVLAALKRGARLWHSRRCLRTSTIFSAELSQRLQHVLTNMEELKEEGPSANTSDKLGGDFLRSCGASLMQALVLNEPFMDVRGIVERVRMTRTHENVQCDHQFVVAVYVHPMAHGFFSVWVSFGSVCAC